METFNNVMSPENSTYMTFPSNADKESAPYCAHKITALTLFSNLLFVGTEIGVVTQYMIEEEEIDCTRFSYTQLLTRSISDSPIEKVSTSRAATNILAILSNHLLLLCDAEQLELLNVYAPYRDVATFQLCQTESESSKISVAFLSRIVQVLSLTTNGAEVFFEIQLDAVPEAICLATNYLGVAVSSRYLSVNLNKKSVTELFQFDRNTVRPFITAIEKDVFLITGPGSLGVIVDATGTSQRPPLQLSPNVLEAFVWKDYVYTVTDEFFTIHNLHNQTQLQTVPVNNATAACFSPEAMHFVFVATSLLLSDPAALSAAASTAKADLVAIGPERWDRFARKLILAGCVNDAGRLLLKQKSRMDAFVQQFPASSKNKQNIFSKRSRRVFGLLGFYYFEQGDFNRSWNYFEKSLIDIRELLNRYEDLLPKGYAFQPDSFYQLQTEDCSDSYRPRSTSAIRSVTDLCLIHTLTEAGASSVSDDVVPDPKLSSQWLTRYEKFLFEFLQKHHKSKFTEPYCHFLETALVKLYVKLSKRGAELTLNELVLPGDRLETSLLRMLAVDMTADTMNHAQDLIQLISSLVHIDVDDLLTFLNQVNAHHALALIYQWQGNLSAALDVWQRLAYGKLQDDQFPGVPFYIAVLRSLSSPTIDHSNQHTNSQSGSEGLDTDLVIPSVYVELVWQQLCTALDAGATELCAEILSIVPVATTTESFHTATVSSNSDEARASDHLLAPSQLLTPANILGKLLPHQPVLARNYLRGLIYQHADRNPAHHNLLGQLYVEAVSREIKHSESASIDEHKTPLIQLRREFCHFLRYSDHYETEKLLQCLREVGTHLLPFEVAIVLGKSGQHRDALDLLITQEHDLSAAICYCQSYLNPSPLESDPSLSASITTTRWNDGNKDLDYFWAVPQDSTQTAEQAFTALLELCLKSDEAKHRNLAFELMNSPEIPLDFVRVLRALPSDSSLSQVKPFLQRALRTVLHFHSVSQIAVGLAKRQAVVAASEVVHVSSDPLPMLTRTGNERCGSCDRELTAYGSTAAFVWSISSDRFFHSHCWKQTKNVF